MIQDNKYESPCPPVTTIAYRDEFTASSEVGATLAPHLLGERAQICAALLVVPLDRVLELERVLDEVVWNLHVANELHVPRWLRSLSVVGNQLDPAMDLDEGRRHRVEPQDEVARRYQHHRSKDRVSLEIEPWLIELGIEHPFVLRLEELALHVVSLVSCGISKQAKARTEDYRVIQPTITNI